MAQVRHQLPYMNFYRFCQLLEQSQPERLAGAAGAGAFSPASGDGVSGR